MDETKAEAVRAMEKITGCGLFGKPTFDPRKIAQAIIEPNAPNFKK